MLLISATVFFGCKKESVATLSTDDGLKVNYQNNVSIYLKEKLLEEDFLNLDLVNMKIDAYQNGDSNFIKIPFKSKSIKTDFIALQSETFGNCKIGTIVHFEIPDTSLPANKKIMINSLRRDQTWSFDFTKNNYRKPSSSQKELVAEIPTLENVTVVAYLPKTGDFTQFAFDNILFLLNPAGASSMGDGTYGMPAVGVLSGGFGDYGNYSDATNGGVVKLEFPRSTNEVAVDINRIFNCFNLLPDAGATYSITINSDIPRNDNALAPFNRSLSPGHSFITITKKNGGNTVTKSYGFYPKNRIYGMVSVVDPFSNVASKMVNNSGHEFNATITKPMTQAQFNLVKSNSIANASKPYSITNNNCTDFASAAWNSAFPLAPDKIVLNPYTAIYPMIPPIPITINNSPQMLAINIGGYCADIDDCPPGVSTFKGNAPVSLGECN